jgi:hypothetical protein
MWLFVCILDLYFFFNKYFRFVFKFVNFVPKGKMSKSSTQNGPKTQIKKRF